MQKNNQLTVWSKKAGKKVGWLNGTYRCISASGSATGCPRSRQSDALPLSISTINPMWASDMDPMFPATIEFGHCNSRSMMQSKAHKVRSPVASKGKSTTQNKLPLANSTPRANSSRKYGVFAATVNPAVAKTEIPAGLCSTWLMCCKPHSTSILATISNERRPDSKKTTAACLLILDRKSAQMFGIRE